MTEFKSFVEETLYFILNNYNLESIKANYGIQDTINHLIRHYPEFATDGKKSWKKLQRYKKYHRFSDRAFEALKAAENEGRNEEFIVKNVLFYEHLPRVSALRKKLFGLKHTKETISKADIQSILKEAEVIILSKEEQIILDASTKKDCILDGVKQKGLYLKNEPDLSVVINSINITFLNEYSQNSICDT